MSARAGLPAALFALTCGNFVIGTGVMLPAGMLNDIASGLSVSEAVAGQLILISGIVVAIGAPVLATLTSRINRRSLLTVSLFLYAAAHLAMAAAPDFATLGALRAAMAGPAAVFTPQAAAAVALLAPPEQRAASIAAIFIGWSIASVIGVPAGGLIAAHLGWRAAFATLAAAALIATLLVWRALPAGLQTAPLSRQAWAQAAGNPVILSVLAVTLASASGQFAAFSCIAPVLKAAAFSPEMIAAVLAAFGFAGVAGNTLASRYVARLGVDRSVMLAIAAMAAGVLAFSLFKSAAAGAIAGALIWGLGTFSSNSMQQSRLSEAAPQLASASIALNTTCMYLGQAAGAAIGGLFFAAGLADRIAAPALALLAAAAAFSMLAARLKGSGKY